MVTFTITLHAWWLALYLAVGVVLFLPIQWWDYRKGSIREGFWSSLGRGMKRRPYVLPASIVLWPLAVWESR